MPPGPSDTTTDHQSTTEEVPTPDPSASSLWKRTMPKWSAPLGLAILLIAVAVHWALSPSPYYKAVPGPVIPLAGQISSAKAKNLSYVTIEVTELNWIQYLWYSRIGHNPNIISAHDLGTTADAADQSYEMRQAKDSAAVLATYIVTGHYSATPTGSVIESILSRSPASRAGFMPGDVIVSVDGHSVTSPTALVTRTISSNGHRLHFGVLRYGKPIVISATPKKINGEYRVGVTIAPYDTLLPPKNTPTINTAGVAGPSGGLMFTLATLNALVPGDLSGPYHIAGTGTISAEPATLGQVGPIGDVALKIQGAISAGNQVFFVDPYDYAAAKMAAGTSITVVPVASVYGALRWLCDNGATDKICNDLGKINKLLKTNLS